MRRTALQYGDVGFFPDSSPSNCLLRAPHLLPCIVSLVLTVFLYAAVTHPLDPSLVSPTPLSILPCARHSHFGNPLIFGIQRQVRVTPHPLCSPLVIAFVSFPETSPVYKSLEVQCWVSPLLLSLRVSSLSVSVNKIITHGVTHGAHLVISYPDRPVGARDTQELWGKYHSPLAHGSGLGL